MNLAHYTAPDFNSIFYLQGIYAGFRHGQKHEFILLLSLHPSFSGITWIKVWQNSRTFVHPNHRLNLTAALRESVRPRSLA
jgi:hypothetical protein